MALAPHQFWQDVYPPQTFSTDDSFADLYPATLPDGRQIALPIRPLPDEGRAVASLILNQASFAVQAVLADILAERLRLQGIELVLGLPTLGLTLASAVAERPGHGRYVPFGISRKFWYEDRLSVPLSSITTPGLERRLYLDPRLLPLVEGRRVALVDDVISTGASITAALTLLAAAGVQPAAIGAAMLQSYRWRERECTALPGWQQRTVGVFETPTLVRGEGGWRAETGTD